ncbi:MAG: hypothetical protein JW810_02205 [Sedimentisphaerales bacterium]|nr:hypothetical protein [Sedimentisphaerales bacterium]
MPIAHWRLNESDGSVAADATGLADGVLGGNPRWQPHGGRIGGCLEFDGTGDYVDCGVNNLFQITGPITVCAWVRAWGFSGEGQTILAKGTTAWQLECYNPADHACRWICNGLTGPNGGILQATQSLDDGQWHHVAGVYDGTHMYLYLDGQLDASQEAAGSIQTNSAPIWIASNSLATDREWFGRIDDARIYDCALMADQIKLLAHRTIHVDGDGGDDEQHDGSSRSEAFRTIQKGIDVSADGDTVLVWPGIYSTIGEEVIMFHGKAITVRSAEDPAILEAWNNYVAVFHSAETRQSVLENFVITNAIGGIFCLDASPTLRHLTVVNNGIGLEAWGPSVPLVRSSIFWKNVYGDVFNFSSLCDVQYSCLERGHEGQGNHSLAPGFVNDSSPNPYARDYHLRSQRGRFLPEAMGEDQGIWILDDVSSACLDQGDPEVRPEREPSPNGGRVNMGAYGNTPYASRSDWTLPGDINQDGIVNLPDYAIMIRHWLESFGWYD